MYFKTFSVFLLLSLSLASVCQESGSTLPDSEFETVEVTKDIFFRNLSDVVSESSGLIFWRDLLWTHNDGGGDAAIYGIDPATGDVVKTTLIKGARNNDWEDITQDAGYIYIGDFGNNSGGMRDLAIYKIHKGSVMTDKDDVTVRADKIAFRYEDQEPAKRQMQEHNFDCEAMLEFERHLYIFTKNWADQKTRLYKMPVKPDMYHVSPITTFEAGGLITGADISPSGKRMALVGYIDFVPFMWLFWDFEGDDFFGGKKLRVEFPEMAFVQTEAIAFASEDELFLSSEKSLDPPSLFKISFAGLINGDPTLVPPVEPKFVTPGIVQQTGQHELSVSFDVLADVNVVVELLSSGWELLREQETVITEQNPQSVTLDIKGLKQGTYFLSFVVQNKSYDGVVLPSTKNPVIKKIEIKH